MPEAIRPWTFVIDILYEYLMLAYFLYQDKTFQGSWNFVSGETRTVLQVCEAFIRTLGLARINIDTTKVIGKESGLLLITDASHFVAPETVKVLSPVCLTSPIVPC